MKIQQIRRMITAFTLTAVMALGSVIPMTAQTPLFNDVPVSHAAFEAINWVADPQNGAFMMGDASSNFNPNRTLTRFEAAQVFAMASGFRHATAALPAEERAMITRSFDTWRPFLDSMAAQFPRWNRVFDREIAFLLYTDVLTIQDVERFMTRIGTAEQALNLTREEAIVWMVRFMGRGAHAQAIPLPHHTPFRDDADIAIHARQYVYYAKEAGLIAPSVDFNPTRAVSRAELATMFFEVLNNNNASASQNPTQTPTTGVVTLTGTIDRSTNTHVYIRSSAGVESFRFASNAVIMIDNVQRTPALLHSGMPTTALINSQREVISLVARTDTQGSTDTTPTPSPAPSGHGWYSDEGFVTAVTAQNITIRTQRVRLSGQIVDEERTFTLAPNARITRGNQTISLTGVGVGSIAVFQFSGSMIHELTLMERERTLEGTLVETRMLDNMSVPALIIALGNGFLYELRVLPATTFSRGGVQGLNWSDLRIGDAIIAEVEYDRLVSVAATGERSRVTGRLTQMIISERISTISLVLNDGASADFFVVPGTFDVYSLRIGMEMTVHLDSREVVDVQIHGGNQTQATAVLGYIQTIRPDRTIVVVEGQGLTARTHTLRIENNTTFHRAGATLNFNDLRVNMNVHVQLVNAQSSSIQSITILP